MSFDPALSEPSTPAEFGEATPQTCLRVVRAAATLAAAADDAALDAFCRSSTRSMACLETVMHATHREAVEAERYAALAEEWDADPSMPDRALRRCATEAVTHALAAQREAGVELTALALRGELERALTPQERAERESAQRKQEAEEEAAERAATGMDQENRHLAAMNGYLAESVVPELGWTAGHVRVLEAAVTGRLYVRDGQVRRAPADGGFSGGRRVSKDRTQALYAARFLTARAIDGVRVLTPTPMGQVALELARLYPQGLHKSDKAAYEARYARVAKRHMSMDDKKAAARRLPALDRWRMARYRRPVTLVEQEARAARDAAGQWEDEGGYCPGVDTPSPEPGRRTETGPKPEAQQAGEQQNAPTTAPARPLARSTAAFVLLPTGRRFRRPRVLDLFCCAGGAAMGYWLAGFDVVGVDIVPRPNYPFAFILGDALEVMREICQEFNLVHASPPCQAHTTLTKGTNKGRTYVDLIPQMREVCEWFGVDWVIENVVGADIRRDLSLCGEMFGLGVIRHRDFETGWLGTPGPEQPRHLKHRGPVRGWRHGVWRDGPYIAAYGKGGGKGTVAEMQKAMGITWTDVHEELTEAIPPAYTRYIGQQFITTGELGAAHLPDPAARLAALDRSGLALAS